MNATDFETLQKYGEEDTKIPDTLEAMMNKNNLLPATVQRWVKLMSKQNFIVKSLEIEKDELYGELLKHYKFEDNVAWGSQREIDSQIYSDPKYISKVKELTMQKYYLEYIQETLGNVKAVAFTIKNYLDWRKMLASSV